MGRLLLAGLLAGLTAGCASRSSFRLPGSSSAAAVPADAPPELDYLVGRDLELDGEVEEALAAYKRALAKDPESPELLRKVAELSARTSHLEDAVAHAERAYALDPDDRSTRLFLGTLYRFLREPARVEQVLREPDGQPFDPDAALLLYGTLTRGGPLRRGARRSRGGWSRTSPTRCAAGSRWPTPTRSSATSPRRERTLREGAEDSPGRARALRRDSRARAATATTATARSRSTARC